MKTYFFSIILLLNLSCNSQQLKIDSEAINLTNNAMVIFNKERYKIDDLNNIELNKALDNLNRAIEIEEKYYLAYTNKATILSFLKQYDDAIETIEIIHGFKKDYAEGFAAQGYYYEKSGRIKQANEKYLAAINAYDVRIKETNKAEDKGNRAFLFLFTKNKSVAIMELEKALKFEPDNKFLESIRQTIETFDRKIFIENI